MNSLKKNDVEAQVEFTLKVIERARVTCYYFESRLRQTSDSSGELLKIGNEQIKTAQNNAHCY